MLRRTGRWLLLSSALLALPVPAIQAQPAQNSTPRDQGLQIISIDVEGGGGTLFITPEGKSLLIDTGWSDKLRITGARDSSDRIVDTLHAHGITRLDYLLVTHYHADHIGGFTSLFAKIPIGTFIDHGVNRQMVDDPDPPGMHFDKAQVAYEKYLGLIKGHPRIVAKVGQTLDIGALHILFVVADGNTIAMGKVPGAGGSDPYCANFKPMANDGGIENPKSLGMLFTFGQARIVALGDLNWNREKDLFCPNHIGPVDVEIAAGHAMDLSGSPAAVNGLRAQVVIVGNSQTKGGDASVLKTYAAEPRLKGLWKLHTSPKHHDTDGDLNMIANTNEDRAQDKFYNLAVRVTPAGQITVTNERNGYSKSYTARGAKD